MDEKRDRLPWLILAVMVCWGWSFLQTHRPSARNAVFQRRLSPWDLSKTRGWPRLPRRLIDRWTSCSYETETVPTDSRRDGQEVRKAPLALPERAEPVSD